jgi:hypothetical protein
VVVEEEAGEAAAKRAAEEREVSEEQAGEVALRGVVGGRRCSLARYAGRLSLTRGPTSTATTGAWADDKVLSSADRSAEAGPAVGARSTDRAPSEPPEAADLQDLRVQAAITLLLGTEDAVSVSVSVNS